MNPVDVLLAATNQMARGWLSETGHIQVDADRWTAVDGTPIRIVTQERQLRGIRIRNLFITGVVDQKLYDLALYQRKGVEI